MDKYVEVEQVLNEVSRFDGYLDTDMLWRLHHAIRSIPAADVQPVIRAKWIKHDNPCYSPFDDTEPYKYQCSACWKFEPHRKTFCPNCGAKMEGES